VASDSLRFRALAVWVAANFTPAPVPVVGPLLAGVVAVKVAWRIGEPVRAQIAPLERVQLEEE